jgi:hypothetical protein
MLQIMIIWLQFTDKLIKNIEIENTHNKNVHFLFIALKNTISLWTFGINLKLQSMKSKQKNLFALLRGN